MKERLTWAMELLGIAAIVAGAWMIYEPAAFIVGGLILFIIAQIKED